MARGAFASLRVRLLLLVLLAAIPALSVTLYTHLDGRRRAAAQVQDGALRLARLVSADHERLIEGARQLLVTLARLPAVRDGDPATCSALFATLLRDYPLYANLGVTTPDGNIVCSALPMTRPMNAADRAWFQRAMESREFAIGEHQIGRLTKKPTVNFGYPVLDEGGRIRAVVFAALDLAWLKPLAARAQLPAGSLLTVIDRNGVVLVRYPEQGGWVGSPMPESRVVKAILDHQGEGTTEALGADGVRRLFAFAPLGRGSPTADAHVSIGIPTTVAFADADRLLVRNLAAVALVAILALAAAWMGADRFVLRPVQALVRVTRRLGGGDLRARTGLTHGHGELSHLAQAFDEMAGSLERAAERHREEEELRRRNYELEQQNRSVQEANRLKTEFVSMVSHELRTPLTSIQGYVDVLLEGGTGTLEAEQQECLGIVKANAQRLLDLIDDLLDIARIEAGRIELHRTSLDLSDVVHTVARTLRPLIERKAQQLTLDLAEALPRVWGDGDRVTQILTNLLSNAHKYTPAGGRITVAARAEGGFVRVEVRDTGVGLTPEEQAQLFTKFFRSRHRAQAGGGTGLGLVITRALVDLHGGEIRVASTPGQGSTFSFSLPATEAAPDAPVAEPVAAPGRLSGSVLVVDDERDIANLIRRYLERAGLHVVLARDGAEALRLARAERPDLITLDVLLPDSDGFTVLERLKSEPTTAAIPVMLVSVLPDDGRGRLLGAVGYIHKPLQEAMLLERVRRILVRDRPGRVLVADDEAAVRALLAGHLRRAGYEVIEAADGAEAVALARQERPGLLLLDIRMPRMDGLAALQALRAEPSTRDLPVVAMGASPGVMDESRPALEALGGATLLSKPCTAEELATAIVKALGGPDSPQAPNSARANLDSEA